MRVQTETQIMFDSIEFDRLSRVEPSIRVGFPTDEIAQAVREEREGDKRNRVKQTKREYAGRHLLGVCSRRDLFTPEYIHGALAELTHLIAVLEEQSTREYWEEALRPKDEGGKGKSIPYADTEQPGPITGARAGGMSLIAPGTDIWGMLAETRERMCQIAKDALPLLQRAAQFAPLQERITPADLKAEGI